MVRLGMAACESSIRSQGAQQGHLRTHLGSLPSEGSSPRAPPTHNLIALTLSTRKMEDGNQTHLWREPESFAFEQSREDEMPSRGVTGKTDET